jgi:hypothetical protein
LDFSSQARGEEYDASVSEDDEVPSDQGNL